MPTLHNQTRAPLTWDMSGMAYSCEPWGPVDVPDRLVPICKSYGLPLGPVPVAPELRAQQRVSDEQESAKNDVLRALKSEITAAKAEAAEAGKEVERMQLQLQQVRTQKRELGEELESTKRDYKRALEDKKAAEDLLAETARQATDAEERAIKAEALLNEMKGKRAAPSAKK